MQNGIVVPPTQPNRLSKNKGKEFSGNLNTSNNKETMTSSAAFARDWLEADQGDQKLGGIILKARGKEASESDRRSNM